MHIFRTLGKPILGENKVHSQIYHSGGQEGVSESQNPILCVYQYATHTDGLASCFSRVLSLSAVPNFITLQSVGPNIKMMYFECGHLE